MSATLQWGCARCPRRRRARNEVEAVAAGQTDSKPKAKESSPLGQQTVKVCAGQTACSLRILSVGGCVYTAFSRVSLGK